MNIQSDREFQELSEYLLAFPKDYYSSRNPSKILMGKMARKTTDWESDHGSISSHSIYFSADKKSKVISKYIAW